MGKRCTVSQAQETEQDREWEIFYKHTHNLNPFWAIYKLFGVYPIHGMDTDNCTWVSPDRSIRLRGNMQAWAVARNCWVYWMRGSHVAYTSSLECISETESVIVLGEVEFKPAWLMSELFLSQVVPRQKGKKNRSLLGLLSVKSRFCKLHFGMGHSDLAVTSSPSLTKICLARKTTTIKQMHLITCFINCHIKDSHTACSQLPFYHNVCAFVTTAYHKIPYSNKHVQMHDILGPYQIWMNFMYCIGWFLTFVLNHFCIFFRLQSSSMISIKDSAMLWHLFISF